ncbi:DUF177 domain-containing protein [Paucibacter sp. B2R-40]|uniref:YceD family protein n=1 Tax=Paucibacter sp. B2R-40 TaxID=2893554 RepID=UPI0021E3C3C1|nr:DUF177 domain-containing protein [Paucibacter sp. B2R-40]MCV2354510.1 DUF177 domain-containing protein [Paucibacter sp. B2R-40]
MKEHLFFPEKLDVAAFARDGGQLNGELPAASLLRLADAAAPEAPASAWAAVKWSATGERREPRGAQAQAWLHLEASAEAQLTCQRCLRPVQEHVEFARWFRFVHDEAAAAEIDAETEEDVLVLSRNFDLFELIEDELLLSLPLVPRHEECPEPLAAPLDPALSEGEPQSERPHPFAALAALKKQGPAQ